MTGSVADRRRNSCLMASKDPRFARDEDAEWILRIVVVLVDIDALDQLLGVLQDIVPDVAGVWLAG
jgi:hypothetical protein